MMPHPLPPHLRQPPSPAMAPWLVPPGKSVVIGITGEPGAGKSSLARQLVALGAALVDVDVLGHELIETPPVKKRLVEEFGEDIVGEDGDIDRRKLATKAFATPAATATLNGIVHPKLSARTKAVIKKAGNFVVIDAALLHELGLGELCTTTIYVRATRESRIGRVGERGWDESELTRREAALGSADARRKACQLAVDNSGDPALLAAFAKTILARQLGVDLSSLRRAPAEDEAQESTPSVTMASTAETHARGAAAPGVRPRRPSAARRPSARPSTRDPSAATTSAAGISDGRPIRAMAAIPGTAATASSARASPRATSVTSARAASPRAKASHRARAKARISSSGSTTPAVPR